MESNKRETARARRWALENEPLDGSDSLISWEEADWTRQALGMSIPDFACLIGVKPSDVYHGQKHPQTYLRHRNALLLRLGVNRQRSRI